jgi:hypothetical protein
MRGDGRYVTYIDYVLAGMQRAGAVVLEEEQFALRAFRDRAVLPSDKLVSFFMSEDNAKLLLNTVRPENRWVHVIDERATSDGRAYQGRIEYCKRFDVRHAVLTYTNPVHVQQILDVNIGFTVMPCCVSRRRTRTQKPNVISCAGTFEEATYPSRARVKRLIEPTYPVVVIPPVGKGETYYAGLDGFQFGAVCRAGYRDRFVAKYVEFGMCHVLPVGDCPSYMPEEMKRLMVNVEGQSDEWVVREIQRLLRTPAELFARQEAYCEATHRHFDLLTNAQRVVNTIQRV